MSWSITAIGKPSEIAQKVKDALVSSRAQSGHGPVFDHIEGAVEQAFDGAQDAVDYGTSLSTRTVLVESTGHIDASGGGQFKIEARTIYGTEAKPVVEASAT